MSLTQADLDVLASTLDIRYQVEDNLTGGRNLFRASITITNTCDVPLQHQPGSDGWNIYFCHLRMVEPASLPMEDFVDKTNVGVRISHLNGSIFSLSPLSNFKTLKKNDSVIIELNGQHYSASRSDVFPNWYLQLTGLEPRVIACTQGEGLDFVGDFDEPKKYKRFDYILSSGKRRYDTYHPFSPEERFLRYPELKVEDVVESVVPTPVSYCERSEKFLDISTDGWKIVLFDEAFLNEAKYLCEKLKIPVSNKRLTSSQSEQFPTKSIVLRQSDVKSALSDDSLLCETYKVAVDCDGEFIVISANTAAGAFYGVQTLISLSVPMSVASSGRKSGQIPDCQIRDTPRYPYRGMHVDISRNFQSKDEILLLLDVMAGYKLNKFHFHLTDDEGWRLEIPGLEELTQVGSVRGHDPDEQKCLIPLLGSGPEPSGLGCGYYSVEDYREILRYARDRHIEVIPEIDMPGHSHAAVRAMKARYDRLMSQNEKEEAQRYLLFDPMEQQYKAYSTQMLGDNSMNPGLESTFNFIDKVVSEVKTMHADIQPLQTFHFGGDEVPYEAWDESLACLALVKQGKVKTMADMMEYFVVRVAEIVHRHQLDLGAWQDGIVVKKNNPYSRAKFPNPRVLVHYWRNVWESGQAFDAFKLANNDFEVVLAPGTHLYFDHPHEPDPEERGLFWACRYVDCHKVFCFTPDHLMSNADVKLTGDALTKADLRDMQEREVPLRKPGNVKGIQGQIWTELIRTRSQFHAMVFPRLLALAERAWHCAVWEAGSHDGRSEAMEQDWRRFSHTLGHKELKRLEAADVPYHIPPAGARVSSDGQLELRSCYPGQPLSYSMDGGQSWRKYSAPVSVEQEEQVMARVSSYDGKVHSRPIKIEVNITTVS